MATAALPGQDESGDLHLVEPFPGGVLLVAIDGLGHGGDAALAAHLAGLELRQDAGAPLTVLFERCHKRLVKTRGVVMSAACFEAGRGEMTWLGVGNVEGALVRAGAAPATASDSILLTGGVIGYQLPRLRPTTIPVARGDTLIFATDGIRSGFLGDVHPELPPQELAERTLATHSRGNDDALVLVARYRGEGG